MFEHFWTNIFFANFFFQKCSNFHETCGMGWIERKIKFQNFPIFICRVMVIFVTSSPQISMNFHDNLKNKNHKHFLFSFSFYSAHSAYFTKIWPFLRGGGGGWGLHILGWEKYHFFIENKYIGRSQFILVFIFIGNNCNEINSQKYLCVVMPTHKYREKLAAHTLCMFI